MKLSKGELLRYSRQLALPQLGSAGQSRLKNAKVAIVGAGGLGSPAALYLAGAGIGELKIIDGDAVAPENLHRQVLFSGEDVGKSKAVCAAARLSRLNPGVKVVPAAGRLTVLNAAGLLGGYDAVLDCTDNFKSRRAINEACVWLGIPCVYGAIYRFEGQLAVFGAGKSGCYACLYENTPREGEDRCSQAGILGPVAGVIGSLQALEAVKLISGIKSGISGRLAIFDFDELGIEVVNLRKNPACPVCGKMPGKGFRLISPEDLNGLLESGGKPAILDVRFDWERELCRLPGDSWADLDDIGKYVKKLGRREAVVIYCKDTSRSVKAAKLLSARGFGNLFVLDGGLSAWADRVDVKMPRY